ncbi:uncharacterized protein [Zea mays]|uniref:Uncharacterized protein n=1 Tax=Zea mays TaxID=4577 RepID=B4FEF5_MAIZE|nr:uncharacterized protein LOC118476694 [Zea mays]ACF80498.1 unknown [Zea mays]|eukprot:NP_001131889.1 uncharacterized protein LOC100193270 [Zea mays]
MASPLLPFFFLKPAGTSLYSLRAAAAMALPLFSMASSSSFTSLSHGVLLQSASLLPLGSFLQAGLLCQERLLHLTAAPFFFPSLCSLGCWQPGRDASAPSLYPTKQPARRSFFSMDAQNPSSEPPSSLFVVVPAGCSAKCAASHALQQLRPLPCVVSSFATAHLP